MSFVYLESHQVPVGNIFCIGRNYAAHAQELGNKIEEEEPIVFLKPTHAILQTQQDIVLPSYSRNVQHECELVVLMGPCPDRIHFEQALDCVAGYGLGLDLTARDAQNQAKEKGYPWLKGKGFRGAACVSHFINAKPFPSHQSLQFSLEVNGETRQVGDPDKMIFSITWLIVYLSNHYGLQAGDLIFTGTPEGVAPIVTQDHLIAKLNQNPMGEWLVK